MKILRTLFFTTVAALVTPQAFADSVTSFQALVSTASDRTLTVRTVVTWNGDRKFHEELVYLPETFVHKECDAAWVCAEGKGSRRFWYRAFQKPSGFGFVLVKVAGLYESVYWDSVALLNEDLRQTPLAELKPGCQDFYSDGSRLIVVEALEPTHFDPMVKSVDAKATIYDTTSGRPSGSADMKDQDKWKLLLRNECGLRYSE